jgi:hypothetical protein
MDRATELQLLQTELMRRGLLASEAPEEVPEQAASNPELMMLQDELMRRGLIPPSQEEITPQELQLPPQSSQSPESMMSSLVNMPGRTLGSLAGGMAENANQLVAAPLAHLTGGALQGAGYLANKISPQVGETLENMAQKAYQAREQLKQPYEEWASHKVNPVAKKVGEFALPIPPAAKAASLLTKSNLAKEAAQAIGAGTAIEGLKDTHVLPEFAGRDSIEDFFKSLVGMKAAGKVTNPKLSRSVEKTIQEEKKQHSRMEKALGRAFSIGAKPDEQILHAAKKEGIELPFNVKLGSQWGDFAANNIFKSMFVSKQYKNMVDNAHKGVLDKFQEKINKIHPEYIEKDTASHRYKEGLTTEKEAVEGEVKKLYENAYKTITDKDRVVPSKTLQAIQKLNKEYNVPSPSDSMKFVQSKIGKIMESWGGKEELPKELAKYKDIWSPEAMMQAQNQLGMNQKKPISLQALVKQREALMKDIKYGEGEAARGARGSLKLVIKAIDDDIMQSSNHAFKTQWRTANALYKNDVKNRVQSDVARSLLDGTLPKEAFKYMGSPQEIQELSKILGNTPNSQEIIGGLKRAKFQQLVEDRVKNSDGTFSYANLANLYSKRSEKQPLLRELGGESYEGMKRLATIAQGFVRSGKSMANPSGTSQALAEQEKLGKAIHALLTVGVAGTGALKTAGISIGLPYVFSKMVANPRYVDAAVDYALARQRNNVDMMLKAEKKMKKIFNREILTKAPLGTEHQENQKED